MKSFNSAYWRKKADEIFMKQFRGLPCEYCGKTDGTCGHHLIGRSRSKALRYDVKNIVVLCAEHHTLGTDCAPHSLNHLAVEKFVKWFEREKPEQHRWIEENANIERRYSYKQAFENMKNGKFAWE